MFCYADKMWTMQNANTYPPQDKRGALKGPRLEIIGALDQIVRWFGAGYACKS